LIIFKSTKSTIWKFVVSAKRAKSEEIGDAVRDLFVMSASSLCCTSQSILNNKPDHPFSHSDIFIRFVRGMEKRREKEEIEREGEERRRKRER
jgi:hypothetical protein